MDDILQHIFNCILMSSPILFLIVLRMFTSVGGDVIVILQLFILLKSSATICLK